MIDKFNHVALTVPNYSYTFNFEKNFVYSDALTTITNHYPNCFYYSAIYVILIFTGKYYMSSRPKLELRGALALWNILLAVFSIFGFLRMSSEMYHVLSYYGFYHSVCVPSFLTQDPVTAFWSLLFILSKIVEFGDTAFIVLRKQPLMFLHWYHHITVFLYAWLCFIETTAYARWNAVVNFFRSLLDVFLLCSESNTFRSTKMDRHDDHYVTDSTNDLGLLRNYYGLQLCKKRPSRMPR